MQTLFGSATVSRQPRCLSPALPTPHATPILSPVLAQMWPSTLTPTLTLTLTWSQNNRTGFEPPNWPSRQNDDLPRILTGILTRTLTRTLTLITINSTHAPRPRSTLLRSMMLMQSLSLSINDANAKPKSICNPNFDHNPRDHMEYTHWT